MLDRCNREYGTYVPYERIPGTRFPPSVYWGNLALVERVLADEWSVVSSTAVISGIEPRMADWMPSRSVSADIAQPWQPPPIVTNAVEPSTRDERREAAVGGDGRVHLLVEQLA